METTTILGSKQDRFLTDLHMSSISLTRRLNLINLLVKAREGVSYIFDDDEKISREAWIDSTLLTLSDDIDQYVYEMSFYHTMLDEISDEKHRQAFQLHHMQLKPIDAVAKEMHCTDIEAAQYCEEAAFELSEKRY